MKKLFNKYKEIISYLFFGVMTTVVNYIFYILFDKFILSSLDNSILRATVCNIIAWVFAVAFAYVTNKLWVFESRSWNIKVVLPECGTFVLSRLVTGILDFAILPLLMSWGLDQTIFGITGAWAKLITSIAVIILNYIFSKFIIFRKKRKETEDITENEK